MTVLQARQAKVFATTTYHAEQGPTCSCDSIITKKSCVNNFRPRFKSTTICTKLDLNITEKFVTNVITIINVDLEYLLVFLYQIYSPVLTFYSIYLMLNKLYDLPYLYLFHYIYQSQNCSNFVKCVTTISKFKTSFLFIKFEWKIRFYAEKNSLRLQRIGEP